MTELEEHTKLAGRKEALLYLTTSALLILGALNAVYLDSIYLSFISLPLELFLGAKIAAAILGLVALVIPTGYLCIRDAYIGPDGEVRTKREALEYEAFNDNE